MATLVPSLQLPRSRLARFMCLWLVLGSLVPVWLLIQTQGRTSAITTAKTPTFAESIIGARYRPRDLQPQTRSCVSPPWTRPTEPLDLSRLHYQTYFSTDGCLIEGTAAVNNSKCVCETDWFGDHCSIPRSVWEGLSNKELLALRPRLGKHRRLVQAFPFNIEFDMLDARFAELAEVVDVYVILESNYTAYGRPKPLYLLQSLQEGYYNGTACKIVHVLLPYFPEEGHKDGWVSDNLHRDYICQYGLVRQLLGLSESDLLVLTDADELPTRESLLFLKTHDGYPEPVRLCYEYRSYGFFWGGKARRKPKCLPAVATLAYVRHVLGNKCIGIRSGLATILKVRALEVNHFMKIHNGTVLKEWPIGQSLDGAGWHCSWCLSPKGIQNKLLSAQNGDFPRWGDCPEKVKIPYIERLIASGSWFDGSYGTHAAISPKDEHFAPRYLMEHFSTYRSLLINPHTEGHSSSETTVKKVRRQTGRK